MSITAETGIVIGSTPDRAGEYVGDLLSRTALKPEDLLRPTCAAEMVYTYTGKGSVCFKVHRKRSAGCRMMT